MTAAAQNHNTRVQKSSLSQQQSYQIRIRAAATASAYHITNSAFQPTILTNYNSKNLTKRPLCGSRRILLRDFEPG
jgi:hypothetical protein